MERLLQRLRHQPLSQQLALAAAGCCLLATLVLVIVAAQSTQSIQNTTLNDHAQAAVEQLATRAAAELATGNRLGLVAELQFYTDQPLFAAARVLDVEGAELATRGTVGTDQLTFRHAVRIDGDTAGSVELDLDLSAQTAAREALIWGLVALSFLLSAAVYALTRPMGQRLASNISEAVAQLDAISDDAPGAVNEVVRFSLTYVDALRIDTKSTELCTTIVRAAVRGRDGRGEALRRAQRLLVDGRVVRRGYKGLGPGRAGRERRHGFRDGRVALGVRVHVPCMIGVGVRGATVSVSCPASTSGANNACFRGGARAETCWWLPQPLFSGRALLGASACPFWFVLDSKVGILGADPSLVHGSRKAFSRALSVRIPAAKTAAKRAGFCQI